MPTRTLAISDIHGELDLLEQLLAKSHYDAATDQLVLLGDYIDRGPKSMQTLEYVMKLHAEGAIVLKGNHEDLMLRALDGGSEEDWTRWIVRNGGYTTLQSYGFTKQQLRIETGEAFRQPKLDSEVLDRHLKFVRSLRHYYETEEFICVHAGIPPGKTPEQSDPFELLWIREEFHRGYHGSKKVIFGHTPTRGLHNDEDNDNLYYGDNRIIGIDGGAVFGGQLNALVIESGETFAVKNEKSILD
ncbi:metallophosphoesterase family protein [Saccharibacillus sp. JS10]|uniref:metallophosphoesterase family protein n=1 Tax=Saccharibacillus sp. JS10 TaxID=2950552 RepID=UPI00210D6E6F|nr:metallophosphoesterase family protein [Saccharibacillus sp. JS10]MCQ4088232.1 serine/threonine protein phosphatase [Saccharibacillus sp. JS10]